MSEPDPEAAVHRMWISDALSVPIDGTRVAVWERYLPYALESADWRYYRAFLDRSPGDSMGKRIRFLALCAMVRHALGRKIPGQFAECGVFKGHSAFLIASILREQGYGGELLLFDSFEGLSAPGAEDLEVPAGFADTRQVQQDLRAGKALFRAPLHLVQANLAEFDFIEYRPGWVPACFASAAQESFAFVHIDVDLYQPIRDSLEFFYPRLAAGGVVQFDDYNLADWPGATRAVDEFLARNAHALFFPLPLGGAFLIK